MLDRRIIRETPDVLRKALADRGSDFDLDELIRLEARRRELLAVEGLKAHKNTKSKQIGQVIQSGGDPEPLKAQVAQLTTQIQAMEEELKQVDEEFDRLMLEIPNIPNDQVPVGPDETHNEVLKTVGDLRTFDFEPKGHWEIGERLGILGFEQAAKIAGARFVCDIGLGARLERALINFFLDTHTRKHGYTEIMPPILCNAASLIGTSSLPKFEDDLFRTREGYYLIPTAEVPLTNLFQGDIIDGDRLPACYTAYTPCFRSEAGAAGRESRGIIRQHQFHKVELMKFVKPGQGDEELEKLTCDAERVLEMLGLPYRRLALCTGDITFGSAQTFDIEVWMPGMGVWVEISSCSQYGDFQARRCNTRFRAQAGAKPAFVHTMNGSGLACGRSVAAILENYQTENGTVVVPEALRPYMGGVSEILPE